MTDFTPCPKTIRLCLEALSKTARIIDPTMKAGMQKWTDGWDAAIEENRAALEALLPTEADAIADRVVEILVQRKLLSDDPQIHKKARNFLLNDREYKRLAKR